jgi:hypothetical protein
MFILRALIPMLALCSSICAFAQGASSIWDHNGSAVSLSADGASRKFYYQAPRAGLQEVGIQPGTLLFDGRRDGNRYSGTAYVFSQLCGALAYPVSGPVSPDERSVTMYGKAPSVSANCRVVGYRDDVLVFTFSSSSAIAKAVPEDAVTGAFALANVEEEKRQSELRIIQQQEFERQRIEESRQRVAQADQARQQAEAEARQAQQRALQAKQATPAYEPSATADAPSKTGFRLAPNFFREIQVWMSVAYAAYAIVLTLFLWILVSLISTTSVDVLKRRAAISAWIALPSLPPAVVSILGLKPGIVADHVLAGMVLWTDVYTALIIAVGLRWLMTLDVPSVRSLPLATLVFTAITFGAGKLFIEYGTFPDALSCDHPPYFPLSGCGYFMFEGFYAALAWLLLLILCGAVLAPNSNLIRGYDWLNARVRRSLFFFDRRQPDWAVTEPVQEPEAQFAPRSNANKGQEWDKSAIKKAIRVKREELEI